MKNKLYFLERQEEFEKKRKMHYNSEAAALHHQARPVEEEEA